MKSISSIFFTAGLLAMMTIAVSVHAKTPDDETPATEPVCDGLETATPGLYGLCVAYCEAHDAHLLSPGGLMDGLDTPNRNILETYNKLKTETDPAMPCVQQQPQGCPCWAEQQLETSLMPPASNFDANLENACSLANILSGGTRSIIENFENGTPGFPSTGMFFQISAADFENGTGECTAISGGFSGAPPDSRQPLNAEETALCKESLVAHAGRNKIDGIVWDCFTP
jgi:hypothetical protein